MGLDQFAIAVRGEPKKTDNGLEYPERNEIAYWRKHPNLQGWMEELYRSKGGEGEFNCETVELTSEDIDKLEAAINNQALPDTVGFFFGENSDNNYKEQDLLFIKMARQHIAEGYKILYDSWW